MNVNNLDVNDLPVLTVALRGGERQSFVYSDSSRDDPNRVTGAVVSVGLDGRCSPLCWTQ
jgi:hypothetical protein